VPACFLEIISILDSGVEMLTIGSI